ncbi:hypothetical protein OG497_21245 [Streptomyces sp. NBC_01242]|uniref:hypothetical protein n=1 Tax=unclassified Streptomyces TaxID=2593676 RepID=UPI00225301CC|nr:hypothetical protein [Streptomyces sp. NBC_01242]MCX4796548.1 hypothetical protein [Streptomyces sp. NBC_01242]WSP55983.1 hypothetical protein OG306_17515 [Streptomyces sp. NBC_01241]WSU23318.1 hypothetical protein OG508_21800 [Streptomyces sp. NBC_01108]
MSRRDHRNENGRENGHENGREIGRDREPWNDLTGSEMVNDGPERDGPERDGSERDGPQERGPEKSGSQERGSESASQVNPGAGDGADMDEVALRRMLHGAVEHIEPGDGTLDLLQRAVPARRARRRQAAVGMAAAALLIGTAVPAFVHVANSDGSNAANPAIAGHGEQAQGGNGTERDSGTGGKSDGGGSDGPADGGPNRPASTGSPSDGRGQDTDGGLAGGVADPTASEAASQPDCDPGQLSVASAETGAASADGTVYGTFRIVNVSGTDCSVSSSGSVGFQAMGAADPAAITVVQHTAGDAASGLPDPSQEQGTVLLKPSMAYEVKFAWVPKDICPTAGGSPSPTPTGGADGTGGATAAGPGTGGADGSADMNPQSGSEDGDGALDGSVAVTHTPEAGAPVAETKITNACAGTIYRTGVLAPAT